MLLFVLPLPASAFSVVANTRFCGFHQIKVRDFSSAKISISPSEHTSWSDVRTELIAEKKAALRSELETELGALSEESDIEKLRNSFSARERKIEHEVDSKVHNFSATVDIEYNFLAK